MTAVILASAVGSALVLLAISKLIQDGHYNETEATIFATAVGAALGAIATYLGGRDDGD